MVVAETHEPRHIARTSYHNQRQDTSLPMLTSTGGLHGRTRPRKQVRFQEPGDLQTIYKIGDSAPPTRGRVGEPAGTRTRTETPRSLPARAPHNDSGNRDGNRKLDGEANIMVILLGLYKAVVLFVALLFLFTPLNYH